MSKYSYEVDEETFCVRVYSTDQIPPIVLQPNYPDNRPWENKEAAEAWAEQCISGLEKYQQDAPLEPIADQNPAEDAPLEPIADQNPAEDAPLEPIADQNSD